MKLKVKSQSKVSIKYPLTLKSFTLSNKKPLIGLKRSLRGLNPSRADSPLKYLERWTFTINGFGRLLVHDENTRTNIFSLFRSLKPYEPGLVCGLCIQIGFLMLSIYVLKSTSY